MEITDQFKTIIPQSLWKQAYQLIEYVSTYPYIEPDSCKYCGSHYFSVFRGQRQLKCGIPTYVCHDCKNRFSQITGSYFKGTHELASWKDLTCLRLAGKSTDYIATKIPISQPTVNQRVKLLEVIMQDKYPELYDWFKGHNDYVDHELSEQVEAEKLKFNQWLDEVIHTQQIQCPHCLRLINRMNTKNRFGVNTKQRPLFACGRCRTTINLLADSPLKCILHMDKWQDFVKMMIAGESHYKMAKVLGISYKTAHEWNIKMLEQMRLMKLEKLIYWLTWQHRRGYAFRAKEKD